MLHHHPHHHPHQRMLNLEMNNVSLEKISETLKQLASKLVHQKMSINDHTINLPNKDLKLMIKHEKKPRGEIVIKFEIEWIDNSVVDSYQVPDIKIS